MYTNHSKYCNMLNGQDIFKKFSAILFKGDNLCDHVCLTAIKPLFEKGPILKAKNLLLLEKTYFQKGTKLVELPPL